MTARTPFKSAQGRRRAMWVVVRDLRGVAGGGWGVLLTPLQAARARIGSRPSGRQRLFLQLAALDDARQQRVQGVGLHAGDRGQLCARGPVDPQRLEAQRVDWRPRRTSACCRRRLLRRARWCCPPATRERLQTAAAASASASRSLSGTLNGPRRRRPAAVPHPNPRHGRSADRSRPRARAPARPRARTPRFTAVCDQLPRVQRCSG